MAEDEVAAKVLGIPFQVKGINGMAMVIMAVALGGCMFMLYERSKQNEAHIDAVFSVHALSMEQQGRQRTSEHAAIVETMNALKDVNEAISISLSEQNYIILSDDKERQDIKKQLRRPPSLSKKLEH